MIDSRLFDILLVDSDQGKFATVVTPPPSTPLHLRCAGPQMQLSALARREYAVRRTCTQAPHSCIHTARLRSGAGPLPVPKHARTPAPPYIAYLSLWLLTRYRSGPATPGAVRDEVWLDRYVLIESVSTVLSSSWPASVLASDFRVGRSEPCVPALSHRHPLP